MYRCFIDQPLPGLKSIGANLQEQHSRRMELRRAKQGNSPRLQEQSNQSGANDNPHLYGK
jgi:hypothetical protein